MDGAIRAPEAQATGPSAAEVRRQAQAATQRGDFAAAADLWQVFRERFPGDPAGFTGGLAALQALRREPAAAELIAAGLARFPENVTLLAASGTLAASRADWPGAEQAWRALLDQEPGRPGAVVGLAHALAAQGKLAAAEARLDAACAEDPENYALCAGRAEIAARAKNWPLAQRRWQDLRTRFPQHAQPVQGLAVALLEQNAFAEADALLDAALADFPGQVGLAEAHARAAVARADWPEAERRWTRLAEHAPDSVLAFHGIAFARLKQGDPEGAEAIAADAVARLSAHPVLLSLHATIASERKLWPEAERRWGRLRLAFPSQRDAWVHQVRCLRAGGRQAEAASLLAEACARFPADAHLAHLRANLAEDLARRPDNATGLRDLLAQNPADRRLQERAFIADWRNAGAPDPAIAAAAMQLDPRLPHSDDRDLVLRFESLGDNHEFAMVQRHFGAEPISLFRWTDIATGKLAAAIGAGLAGVGEPEHMALRLGGDYRVRDRVNGFIFHTFVKEEQAEREAFFQSQCKRTRFLAREFLDDLREARKIFVFRSAFDEEMASVLQLHAAMRVHGDAVLLYARLADSAHPGGTVEQVAPGILVGYMSSLQDREKSPLIAFDAWIEICRKARAMVDGLDAEAVAAISLRDLMLGFESMGSNCEFGWAQRYCKAEPLGLFRWTLTNVRSVTKAIETQFAGMGEPANTELVLPDDYQAVDPRYGLSMRTFVRGDEADRDIVQAEHARRTLRLREKLLGDLRAGTTIFVHKTARAGAMEEVEALHAAMRQHGPALLLHVRTEEPGYPNGTVRRVGPGLYVGYMDRLLAVSGGLSIAYESWRGLLRNMLWEI